MTTQALEPFGLWVPFDLDGDELAKAADKEDDGDAPAVANITGIASDESEDQQGEILVQKGMDWSYFLSKGYFKLEHPSPRMPHHGQPVGEPTKVTPCKVGGVNAHRVEGKIWLGDKAGRYVYDKARAMEKADSARRWGLSVEGMKLEKVGNKVVRSKVLHVAICLDPVNPKGRMELLKSVAAIAVGYQAPAGTEGAGAGNLSPLVPQNIEGAVTTLTAPSRRSYRLASVAKRLQHYLGLTPEQALAFAKTLAGY